MLFSKISALTVIGLALVDGTVGQNKYPLTGVQTGIVNGVRPPRKDIRDLANNAREYSLFVQGLNAVMADPELTSLTSYFGVGGIHGRPYQAWDGVNPKQMLVDGIPVGYCPHGNVIFGTWHRPYLLLLEQLISVKARAIAATYNSQQWTDSGNRLRLPYWDWALAPVAWPTNLLSTPNVTISTPSGSRSVINPLYRYKFKGQPYAASIFPRDSWEGTQNSTLRGYGIQQTNTTNEAGVASAFAEEGGSFPRSVWNVFAKTKVFNSMTTTNNENFDPNFEGVHGTIHIITGGHMSPADYTGFDPLFYLHHAAVDRQIAMWQAINPNTYVEPAISLGGTWTIYPNTMVNATTPLTPFTQGDRRTPHTSNSVRHIHDLGYSFNDIPSHLLSGAALAANVTARVNQLYNPDGILTKRTVSYTPRRNAGSVEKRQEVTKEWTVNVKVPNGATGKGFSVRLSLNDKPVGVVGILNAPSAVEIAAGAKKVTTGEFSLTEGLVGASDVSAAIRKGLTWTVINNDGTDVPLTQVKGLEIVVAEQSVEAAEDETSFPKFGAKVFHPEILA